ncbi:high-potential iron-sulfur protein [Hydrogenophaga sp.]|uniref:high-potential iron-sulfur protein n=1 Tax=Hydrogenophaga TaxID=47420 RepID=UPI00351F6ED8
MTTRRRFIFMIPASGAVLAAACSDQATPPPAAAPEAAPAAAPMAAPTAPEPAAPPAAPQASGSAPMLDEADPAAVALGYVADTARADKTKYPNHADSQSCANCGLYQGTAGADAGPCPLFAGKQVAAQGWCASYVKKPA